MPDVTYIAICILAQKSHRVTTYIHTHKTDNIAKKLYDKTVCLFHRTYYIMYMYARVSLMYYRRYSVNKDHSSLFTGLMGFLAHKSECHKINRWWNSHPISQIKWLSSCNCLCLVHWGQMLIWEWRCSWNSTDRRCSKCIKNFIVC